MVDLPSRMNLIFSHDMYVEKESHQLQDTIIVLHCSGYDLVSFDVVVSFVKGQGNRRLCRR